MATTLSHHIPTLQHAIADLTGYGDADTLRWQQACVHAAQQLTGTQGRYAGTDTDRLAQGLDLAQHAVVMQPWHNAQGTWWSHQAADGTWCTGQPPTTFNEGAQHEQV